MKNIFITISLFLLLFVSSSVLAQKIYIKPAFGYSFGVHKTSLTISKLRSDISQDTVITNDSYELQKAPFGNGINVELAIGTHLNEKISLEIIGFFQQSSTQEILFSENIQVSQYHVDIHRSNNLTAKMYGFKPNLVFWSNVEKKTKYYLKTGAILGFASFDEEGDYRVNNSLPGYFPSEYVSFKAQYKPRLSLGFDISVGLEVYLRKNLYFFVEAKYENINYIPLERQITEYFYEGKDELNDLTVSEIYTEFVESYSENENVSEHSATKDLQSTYSFSNLGILAGIRINILN